MGQATSGQVFQRGQNSTNSSRIPLPFVVGAICLLVAYLRPGGLSGGQAFLIGFTTTLVIIFIMASFARERRESRTRIVAELAARLGASPEVATLSDHIVPGTYGRR